MKLYNKFTMALLLGAAMGVTSCQNDFDDPGLIVPEATLEANISIADFKKLAWDNNAIQLTEENEMGDYVISGRVISSDATGNIYQSLVIQDETGAMTMTVRRASLYNEYHLGQQLVIDTRGLWLGKYNGLIQLGWLGEPYKGEEQLTFMSFAEFQSHAQLNGLPNVDCKYIGMTDEAPADQMYCRQITIDQLATSGEDMYNMQGQLVEIRNCSFVDGGVEPFAPYQESVNRVLAQEGSSLKINVRNSGYATFYNTMLPKGTGTVRGILSWYGDGSSSTDGVIGGWQLYLRSLDDVMFDSKGSQEDPFTVEEARQQVGQSRSGWVSGYIVGSVKAGVLNVKSINDIVLGQNAEINNNVVIAMSATSTKLEEMMVVNLPQSSALRSEINIVDNPSVVGRVLSVRGDIMDFLGMSGVVGQGSAEDFTLGDAGQTPGTSDVTNGKGTEDSPYSVAQVIKSASDETGVWVEGYVVGYVKDNEWPTGAMFSKDGDEKAANIILSDYPVGQCSTSNSIPVGLGNSVKSGLAVSRNPAIYGKKVKIKGNMQNTYSTRGMRSVSEYKEL